MPKDLPIHILRRQVIASSANMLHERDAYRDVSFRHYRKQHGGEFESTVSLLKELCATLLKIKVVKAKIRQNIDNTLFAEKLLAKSISSEISVEKTPDYNECKIEIGKFSYLIPGDGLNSGDHRSPGVDFDYTFCYGRIDENDEFLRFFQNVNGTKITITGNDVILDVLSKIKEYLGAEFYETAVLPELKRLSSNEMSTPTPGT